jgi:hypothetical protein
MPTVWMRCKRVANALAGTLYGWRRKTMADKAAARGNIENCLNCGQEFTKVRPHQKFCCPSCRWLHWSERHPEFRLSRQEWRELKRMLSEHLSGDQRE